MDRLPDELWLLIVKYLDRKSIGELCAVSKSFYSRFHELAGLKYNPDTYRILGYSVEDLNSFISFNDPFIFGSKYFYVKHNENISHSLILYSLIDGKKSYHSLMDPDMEISNKNREYYKLSVKGWSMSIRKSVVFNSENVIIDHVGVKKNPKTYITFETFVDYERYEKIFRDRLKCKSHWKRGKTIKLSGIHSLSSILDCLYNLW